MNTCRPCGIRGIVTEATWLMGDLEVKDWYLCDRHASLLGPMKLFGGVILDQLPNAVEIRHRQREVTEHEHKRQGTSG